MPTRDIGSPDFYWGTWGQGLLTEWWETSSDLIWPQSVITYGKMRHDPQLKAVLAAFVYPTLRANWAVDGTGCRPEVTRWVADDFGLPVLGADEKPGPARRREFAWSRHLRLTSHSKLVFGHMLFERRYEYDDTAGLYHLVSLGPRMPWTLAQIMLTQHGNQIEQVKQTTQDEPLPASRLVWYAHEMEGAAWAGMSLLRSAFGAWLLKQETWRVHATSIRRFGMGVPQVTAPAGASAAMVTEAQRLASSIRVGDQTGVGMPSGFKFDLAGLTGSVPDALGFIKYLDQQMSKSALAGIVDLGQTEIGSRALGETFLDLFMLALQGFADQIAEETTTGYPGMPGAVVDLVNVNWGEDEPCPRVVCTDIGEQHQATAQALFWLLQYGAITPDPELEAHIRQLWRLPQRKTPQPLMAPPSLPTLPANVPAGPGGKQTPEPAPAKQPAARVGRGQKTRAALLKSFRRQLTPVEIRAGFDPAGVYYDWQQALDKILSDWTPLWREQRDSLVQQVEQRVEAGQLDKLAALKVDTKQGRELLRDAMANTAIKAKLQMLAEAASQGVHIDEPSVKIADAPLARVATARAAMSGNYLSQQAAGFALQSAAGGNAADTADYVQVQLDGLSQRSLRDQLGAALTAAQNAGRLAVLEAAPESAGQAQYVATELLDDNTCEHCIEIDGTEFASLDEAEAAYPNGGYIECEGYDRCRGTVMGVWGDLL